MERLTIGDTGVIYPEGVDKNKFLANVAVASEPGAVKKVFLDSGCNLNEVPGAFTKILTANVKERAEYQEVLKEYTKLGIIEVAGLNLRPACFKRTFSERLKKCLSSGAPYLRDDGTFIKELNSDEEINAYLSRNHSNSVANNQPQQQVLADVVQDYKNQMDPEDKQVYNEIVERLNFLVLDNPTNELLAKTVKNINAKVVDSILRKEYNFLGIGNMIENIMFDGLEVTKEAGEVRQLIFSVFPLESERGRVA